ncbi:MAG: thioredoxin [Candidatus Thiodiazotropha sp. (ex. Lucinisca nassula)]|nr:thioredoxin [Candidatus Thiodiazotropha sp. (ex. Lucinisca nassula)]MBW9272838.1 thioredoxin [Candidatus Thiodiazotropha sp. (ex. Lucinisca nassula)]
MADQSFVFDVTTDRFQQLVLENSMHVPVLVDFWAEWCNPCKTLMPTLAKLADEYQGKFLVAKVNTEQEQQLAAHFQVRSIPSVKLFHQGQVVDEFMGALPEAEIRSFLGKHIPRESDALLAQADAMLLQGDAEGAGTLLKQASEIDPESPRVKISYARYMATTGKLDEAEQLLRALPIEERNKPEVASMLARIEIDRATADSPPTEELEKRLQENPADSEAIHMLASHKVMENDYEGALELLMTLLQKDRSYGDNAAQKEMLRIFELLGGQGDLVKRYRNRMFNFLH